MNRFDVAALVSSVALRRSSLAAALALSALLGGAGCMGEAKREVLLPTKLKGARVLADGEEAEEYKQAIAAVIPFGDGAQVVRVEPAGGTPALVEHMQISVNDPKAVPEGVNVIVGKIDQGMTYRTIIAYPEEPLLHLDHDFEPPQAGEGAILLVSRIDATATIDGRKLPAFAPRKGMQYQSFVSKPMLVKLTPGKHTAVFSAPDAPSIEYPFEVEASSYEVLGASLRKKQKAPEGGSVDLTRPVEKQKGPNDPGSRND